MPSTSQSIIINAPINQVWIKFSDFHDLSWAPSVITNVEKVGSKNGGEVGAKRILNYVFHETLIEFNADKYLLKYCIDDGPVYGELLVRLRSAAGIARDNGCVSGIGGDHLY